MTLTDYVVQKASRAKAAARQLATLSTVVKNKALLAMADALEAHEAELLEANKKDLAGARGLSKAAIDRLTLNAKRIKEMAMGLREVAALPDPVGEVTKMWRRPNGLQVGRMRVPIGVIGIIYESRPNVTADAASLCLKSGNAVVLRGGSEAIQSNAAIVKVLSEAGEKLGIPAGAITFIDNPDRQVSTLLLKQDKLIDLIIPRGGEELTRRQARRRLRLGHGVPGPHPGRPRRGQHGPGDGAHRPLRLAALRGDRDAGPRTGHALSERRGRRRGLRQRLDASARRLPVRPGG